VSDDAIRRLGERIATARVRRGLIQSELARRASITIPTLQKIERGAPGTSCGAYAAVLWALGLLDALESVADPQSDRDALTIALAQTGRRASTPRLDDDF
jgi:transcriptional regulator with XRE-family HTH domain